jgi:hypothetical protein
MWMTIVSKEKFLSSFHGDDITSSGKWLVPIPLGDPEGIWDRLASAARSGELDAVKISSARLDAEIGHHLVCVYCKVSFESYVGETLTTLRELGVKGDLQYKSDKATFDGRDEYLWQSVKFDAIPFPTKSLTQ